MKRVCVFCGGNPGKRPEYIAAATALGQHLAKNGIGLVYGGATVGTMGAVADAALAAGGEVIGVIPDVLVEREVAHRGLTELRVVRSMHERKALMAELSDAFVALPGGIGTFEEFFEVWTWAVLGIHKKPCALFNVANYYDALVAAADRMLSEGFLSNEHRSMVLVESNLEALLSRLAGYTPPDPKFAGRGLRPSES
jgi:uncharacterized protein (TIGR00730 family)